MQFTVKAHAKPGGFPVAAVAGLVQFDGRALLPHEAAQLAYTLEHCAEQAETLAAKEAALPLPFDAPAIADATRGGL